MGAAANSRAMRRIVSAGTRQKSATDFGREVGAQRTHVVEALHQVGELAERREPFGEQHVAHREEEGGVGAGEDRHPLVGVIGGTRATRVDDDDLAAARPDGVELARTSGHASNDPPDACGLPPMQMR